MKSGTDERQHLRELAARALCRKDGHPENAKFEGRPMWESYLDEVDVVFEAIELDELLAGNRS